VNEHGRPRTGGAVRCLASFFYLGYAPFMPGTFGSLPPLFVAWFWPQALPVFAAVTTLLGFALCAPARRAFGSKDPQRFVLDEAAGMSLTLLFVPRELLWFAGAFLLFRILDIFKPWPVGRLDRMEGAYGIMADDVAAGIMGNAVLQIILYLNR